MRKAIIISFFAALTVALACKKNELTQASFTYADDNAAFLKINYASPSNKTPTPSVVLKLNGQRISNNIIYNTPYPGGGLNTQGSSAGDYLVVSPGKSTFTISIPKVGTNEDSIPLYSTELNLQSRVYQTLHVTDSTANTTSVLLTDLSNRPDSGISNFKFINLIPNTTVDLLLGTTVLATGINYKQATDTFSIIAGTASRFVIRRTGTTAALAGYPVSSTATYSIPNQRVFTIYSRGYIGPTGTDLRIPNVSLLFNK